jgi:hypothetical protein
VVILAADPIIAANQALDQRQRDPFVQQLNRVRVAQLVRREPPPYLCLERGVVKLDPR